MINKMIERVAILADLPVPETVPVIREVAVPELWKMRPGKWALYLRTTPNHLVPEIIHIPGYAHLMVHELCHHVQHEAGEAAASPECEQKAYWVQSVYFRLFPEDFQKEWMP